MFFLLKTSIWSQSFFTAIAVSDQTLSSVQHAQKSFYQNSIRTANFNFVSIGNPLAMQQNGVLNLSLPNHSNIWPFKTTSVSSYPNGDYEWGATLMENADSIYGTIFLRKKGQMTFGTAQIDTMDWEIRSLGSNISFIRELKSTALQNNVFCKSVGAGGLGVGNAPNSGSETHEEPSVTERNDCEVDVLVCYTESAKVFDPLVEQTIQLSIDDVNGAFGTSKVNNLHLNLLQIRALTNAEYHEGGANFQIQADNIATNPTINALRESLAADIVLVMTDTTQAWNALGAVQKVGESPLDENKAYAWVNVTVALSPHVFAHEVGHLFGCHHAHVEDVPNFQAGMFNPFGDNTGSEWAHGHYWNKKLPARHYCSILAEPINNVRQFGFYSNPDVKHLHKKTGKSGHADNARKLSEEACRVGAYRTSQCISTKIYGPEFICPDNMIQVSGQLIANSNDYPPPYTYIWRISSNWGQTWQIAKTTASTSSQIDGFNTAPAPQIGDKIFIQLEAGQVNGVHKFTTHWVQTSNQYPSDVCDHSASPQYLKFDPLKDAFEVFPNPVNLSKINVVFNFLTEQNTATLDLISIDGRRLKTLFSNQKIDVVGTELLELPKDLPEGIYLLRLQLTDSVITKRIEIVR